MNNLHKYTWDPETGGILLLPTQEKTSKEPRPVYYREMNLLGMDKHWKYPQNDEAPIMWAEAEKYIYHGNIVAIAKGGALCSPPTITYTDDGLTAGIELQPVDLTHMITRNSEILENLIDETTKRLYNEAFVQYEKSVDLFYVAFSGGKDSLVTLDLVKRTLPHDSFSVVFADTKMEFYDTYLTVEKTKKECKESGINFIIATSDSTPDKAWKEFGPPSTTNRWCCNVFKTAPQIIALREYLNIHDFCGMAFVGVRSTESLSRSKYSYISLGEKHKGQYSCNVILDWNSAEVYLYIYTAKLQLNEAYKKGNRRAGCLLCPRSTERSEFMNHYWYQEDAEKLVDNIRWAYREAFNTQERLDQFIKNGGWKARKNGRDIVIDLNYEEEKKADGSYILYIKKPHIDWKIWIRTIGTIDTVDGCNYTISFRGRKHNFTIGDTDYGYKVYIAPDDVRDVEFRVLIKQVFRKSACCVCCKECQADCPYGYLHFDNGKLIITDKCMHCSQCHEPKKGCLVYKSLERPKGCVRMNKRASLNTYSHFSPRLEWIEQYFSYKNDFKTNHKLGKNMYDFFIPFLRNSGLMDTNGFSYTATVLEKLGLNNQATWGIMLVNLSYTRQVQWVVTTIPFERNMTKDEMVLLMLEDGAKETWTSDVFTSISRLGELPFGEIGFGKATKDKHNVWFIRTPWDNPNPVVVLYSLYKFAKACGDLHQFTLTYLMDESIEREGISPTTIFGLNRNTMIRIINGLAINYPDFISATFTYDLDTITLRKDKKSEDVLELLLS